MAKRQRTRCAILGLLSWQPMSGYDIKKLIEMGLRHFWSESYGQLYPSLNQLVEDGLATRKEGGGSGRRSRHVYSITDEGRRAFAEWLKEAAEPMPVRNETLLKFFLAGRGSADESARIVEEYRVRERERLEEFTASERVLREAIRLGDLPPELADLTGSSGDNQDQLMVFLLTLRHGIRLTEARLDWCDEALKVLRERRRKRTSVKRES